MSGSMLPSQQGCVWDPGTQTRCRETPEIHRRVLPGYGQVWKMHQRGGKVGVTSARLPSAARGVRVLSPRKDPVYFTIVLLSSVVNFLGLLFSGDSISLTKWPLERSRVWDSTAERRRFVRAGKQNGAMFLLLLSAGRPSESAQSLKTCLKEIKAFDLFKPWRLFQRENSEYRKVSLLVEGAEESAIRFFFLFLNHKEIERSCLGNMNTCQD